MGGWFGGQEEFRYGAVQGEVGADCGGAHERGNAGKVDDTGF